MSEGGSMKDQTESQTPDKHQESESTSKVAENKRTLGQRIKRFSKWTFLLLLAVWSCWMVYVGIGCWRLHNQTEAIKQTTGYESLEDWVDQRNGNIGVQVGKRFLSVANDLRQLNLDHTGVPVIDSDMDEQPSTYREWREEHYKLAEAYIAQAQPVLNKLQGIEDTEGGCFPAKFYRWGRFPMLDYPDGAPGWLRYVALHLYADGLIAVHHGEQARAIQRIHQILVISDTLARYGDGLETLMACSIKRVAYELIEASICHESATIESVEEIQKILAKYGDAHTVLYSATVYQAFELIDMTDHAYWHVREWAGFFTPVSNLFQQELVLQFLSSGLEPDPLITSEYCEVYSGRWRFKLTNWIDYLQKMSESADDAHQYFRILKDEKPKLSDYETGGGDFTLSLSDWAPSKDRSIDFLIAIARDRIMTVAVACKRYQLDHGNWPDDLDQLIPAFLPAPPIDPFSGQPIRLAVHPEGLVIYSIGDDETDDGGKPVINKPGDRAGIFINASDIVYLMPNSAAQ